MKAHKVPQAIAAFEALGKDNPNLSGVWTDLGILYAQTKKRDAAIDAMSHAVSVNPANAVAYNWLGVLNREAGNYTQAEAAYRQALAVRSDYASAHYNLAILYDQYMNRPQDALDQYHAWQQISGSDDLKVQAWIKMLEARLNPAPASDTTGGKP
jgi:tetratricopeptide (TPR) repeat protein